MTVHVVPARIMQLLDWRDINIYQFFFINFYDKKNTLDNLLKLKLSDENMKMKRWLKSQSVVFLTVIFFLSCSCFLILTSKQKDAGSLKIVKEMTETVLNNFKRRRKHLESGK